MGHTAAMIGLSLLQGVSFALYWITERDNAPWLTWWRRYLSLWPLGALLVGHAGPKVSIVLVFSAVGLLHWNSITAALNRRNGKRGKPRPSLGGALTAVQQAAFYREAHDAR